METTGSQAQWSDSGGGPFDIRPSHCSDVFVAGAPETSHFPPVSLALCISGDCLDRFGPIVRHLVVGLVDHVSRIRLISFDPRVEGLALGPCQAVVHSFPRWPVARRRLHRIVDAIGTPIPTVIHAMSASSYQAGLLLAEEFDADLVLQVTSPADCNECEKYAESHVGRFLCFSEPLSIQLQQQLGTQKERVEVVRPGVFAADRPSAFSRADRVPSIVCTAPFVRQAGIDRVIKAADMIGKRGRKAMFFLLGQGPLESSLRRRARELNVLKSVSFARLGGDVYDVIAGADIFLHPSPYGASYIDALEAMGAGLAVVSAPDPAVDFLHPGQTAVVVEGQDVSLLANAIDELLTDRALGQRLGAAALNYVRKHHSMSTMADRIAATYRQLLLARSTFALRES